MAIIGVLVAISIPIFTAQLEKAREATDEANLRAAYAEVMSAALTESAPTGGTMTGTAGSRVFTSAPVAIKQTQSGWQGSVDNIGGIAVTSITPNVGGNMVVTFTESSTGGTVEFSAAS